MECLSFPNYGNFVVVGSQRRKIQIVPHGKGRRGWIWQLSGDSYRLIKLCIDDTVLYSYAEFANFYAIFLSQKVQTVLERVSRHNVVFTKISFKKVNFKKKQIRNMESDEPTVPAASFGKRSMGYKRQVRQYLRCLSFIEHIPKGPTKASSLASRRTIDGRLHCR